MNSLVTISISKDITKDFKKIQVPFKKILDLVKSDFNYSAGIFNNGHRKQENYANYSDMIILDIDDGMTIREASELMKPFTHIIATTKSHLRDKNGLTCERFRILLPTETPVNLNSEEYKVLMMGVLKRFSFCDQVCKDSSRFYYPAKDSIVTYWQGFINFVWEDFYNEEKKEIQKQIEINRRLNNFHANEKRREPTHTFEDTKEDYLRKILNTNKLLELIKFETKFGAGSRNNYLYSIGCYLKENNLSDNEVASSILWINSCGDGITEQEIKSTIFKSLRLSF